MNTIQESEYIHWGTLIQRKMTIRNPGIYYIIIGAALLIPTIVLISSTEQFRIFLGALFFAALIIVNLGFGVLPAKKKYLTRTRWAVAYLIAGVLFPTVAVLLKYFKLNGAGICLVEGILFLCFAYVPLLVRNRYEKWLLYSENKTLLLFLCAGDLLSLVLILLGILFNVQHWPGGFAVLTAGGLFLVSTLFSWNQVFKYVVKKRKEAEDIANAAYKEITESIAYAKRIQQSKLPEKSEIQKELPDSFVLFKPKAIVSGDFYYFHRNTSSVFIASADCTGHGVPGALLSMICSEKLDEAFLQSSDTSEILALLNKGIKKSLRQTDSDSTSDGMDIALCAVDTSTRVLKYAGANRPLWIISGGMAEVREIKGTKMAIGGTTDDNQYFETHTLQLQRNDCFYIFSDGYADTFGGADGKKLTTRKFRELLLSIRDISMAEQEKQLDNFIENWKAGSEQVDDILVIGVRL